MQHKARGVALAQLRATAACGSGPPSRMVFTLCIIFFALLLQVGIALLSFSLQTYKTWTLFTPDSYATPTYTDTQLQPTLQHPLTY